jgi:ketosteroid isomerase-like protein
MNTEANREVCIAFMQCLERLDFSGAALLSRPDAIFCDSVRGEMRQSDYLKALSEFAPHYATPLRLKLLSSTAEADRIVLEMESHVVLTSGFTYQDRYAIVFHVTDGKITRCNEYLDTAHALDAVRSLTSSADGQ